jgi:4-diphosphocytidyl-2-C-methyl-D-erythritol kinase
VGGVRPDGYHEIASRMCAISLADRLEFRPRPRGIVLAVDGPCARGVPRGPTNLVVRAARLLAAELGETRGAAIRLTKRVPHGAGLGGGSSDAAATLRGLLALWGRRLPRARRLALAAALGSDVAFFTGPSPALASGRGETLRPLPPPRPALRFVLVAPSTPIATAWAYAQLARGKSRLTARRPAAKLLQLRAIGDARGKIYRTLFNDLEQVVLPHAPEVRQALAALHSRGVVTARMSGSGSAVFGLGPTGVPLGRIAERLRREGYRVFVARSVRAGSRTCREKAQGRRKIRR